MKRDEIFHHVESLREEMVELQKELTRRPALGPESGGQGEKEKADFLKAWIVQNLKKAEVQEFNAPDPRVPCGYRPNLIVFYPGKDSKRTLWVMSHMDVVPSGDLEQWKHNPFEAWVEDGKIFGRGVEDNQQEMVASLAALQTLERLDLTPPDRIGIVLVSDEETGSEHGIRHILKVAPKLFKPQDLIVVPDAGSQEGIYIEVAEKSILWIRFTVHGKQTHASTPDLGVNARKASAYLTVRLCETLAKRFPASNPLFDPPLSTFEPTKVQANVPNINTIPEEEVFYFDCRVLPEYPLKEVTAVIDEVVRSVERDFTVSVEMDYPQREEAAPPTPEDAPVIKRLSRAVRSVLKEKTKTIGIGGGTVAAVFRKAGLNAAVWAKQDELAHEPNEYSVIDNMVDDAKVYVDFFLHEERE